MYKNVIKLKKVMMLIKISIFISLKIIKTYGVNAICFYYTL